MEDNTSPGYIANQQPEDLCRGEFIRARLDPAGDRYTVSIGTDRTPRTFAVR